MLFNSKEFLAFFLLVTAGYFALPGRWRWVLLLSASCYFYMAFIPVYILILAATIFIDYFAGLAIENAKGPRRKQYLLLSVAANVGVLFFFKYFNFFNANLGALARALDWNYGLKNLEIILPIGLSFHTFQAMSYTFEVYYGRQKAERHLGIYALYVMYYPQLVAGPIERPQNLLPQFHADHAFDARRFSAGLQLMLWGLFKKVVVADRLTVIVDQVYNNPGEYSALPVLLATYGFAFQIYCDFSGYSDIAIGSSQVMGVTLMKNFDQPYFARSIPEFWRRWHISLSTWFRDYLYIPMGGSQVPRWRRCVNLMTVFMVSGLWHGGNWTFVVWGAIHGAYMVASLLTTDLRASLSSRLGLDARPRLSQHLSRFVTFHLACFAWIFFRANSWGDAVTLIRSLAAGAVGLGAAGAASLAYLGLTPVDMAIGVAAVIALEAGHALQRTGPVRERLLRQPAWVRWPVYYAAVVSILVLGKFNVKQFIYFQF